jgi:DNA-binding MarR family transcriptional regulator
MSSESSSRRRTVVGIKEALREVGVQLALLNHHVSARLEMRDVDLDCLDLIARHGPLSPSALAKLAGLHPATLTGVLDRLERGAWISRDRDPADRRGVAVSASRERAAEIFKLYGGMNDRLDEILATYSGEELTVLAGFLRRTAEAGRSASDELAEG